MMSHSTAPGVTIRDIVRDEFGEHYPLSHQALYMSYWHLKLNTSQKELIFSPNPFHYLYTLPWAMISHLPLESKPIDSPFKYLLNPIPPPPSLPWFQPPPLLLWITAIAPQLVYFLSSLQSFNIAHLTRLLSFQHFCAPTLQQEFFSCTLESHEEFRKCHCLDLIPIDFDLFGLGWDRTFFFPRKASQVILMCS